jgi:hypothetical protein
LEFQQKGLLTRKHLPLLKIYSGKAPWGDIIMWAGIGEFGDIAIQVYQEFPENLQFYLIDDVFEPGSVKFLFSNRLPYHTVNWTRAANGAYVAMARGSKVSLNVWTKTVEEVRTVVNAFKSAGFRNVRAVGGPGPGTMILGVR